MALQPTERRCEACGAAVRADEASFCARCAEDLSEDTSDAPTVVAPPAGLFSRLNTEDSLEGRPIPASTPGVAQLRETLDNALPTDDGMPPWMILALGGVALTALGGAAAILLTL